MRRIKHSIAILDLDGLDQIVDTTARAKEAERRVKAHFEAKQEPVPAPDTNEYKEVFYGRDAFFDESLLSLDCLNSGVNIAISRLRQIYEDIYILTSRPDFLGRQTMLWLKEHGIELADEEVRFKLYAIGEDKREQFTSTPAWKSTIVYQAAWAYSRVLFVDDDPKNRRAVAALKMVNVDIREGITDYTFYDGAIIL